MAEKIYIIILKVDLDCCRCYKIISKTICELQERENIQTVAYDEKNNKVTISGPFDPEKLCKKLCCKACKVIKDIQIKEKKEEKNVEKPQNPPPAGHCGCGCRPCCGRGCDPPPTGHCGCGCRPCCGKGCGCVPPLQVVVVPPLVVYPPHCGGKTSLEFFCEQEAQSSCGII